jgi:hypothetical protein
MQTTLFFSTDHKYIYLSFKFSTYIKFSLLACKYFFKTFKLKKIYFKNIWTFRYGPTSSHGHLPLALRLLKLGSKSSLCLYLRQKNKFSAACRLTLEVPPACPRARQLPPPPAPPSNSHTTTPSRPSPTPPASSAVIHSQHHSVASISLALPPHTTPHRRLHPPFPPHNHAVAALFQATTRPPVGSLTRRSCPAAGGPRWGSRQAIPLLSLIPCFLASFLPHNLIAHLHHPL